VPAFYKSMGHVPEVGCYPVLSEQINRHDFTTCMFIFVA
jgi:hypothetical protein